MRNDSTRVQFTIWGQNTAAGIAAMFSVETALDDFLDQLNLIGIPGLLQYNNLIVGERDGFVSAPQPGNPLRLIDAMIFADANL